jgi:carboxyl-terminal processing protease
MTKRLITGALIIATLLAAGLAFGLPRGRNNEAWKDLERFSLAYQQILTAYVDEVDSDLLIDQAIKAMVEELDAFSALLEEDRYDDLMTRSKQEFGGLGIVIGVRDDYPTVISPIDDTPAARLGILGGDRIEEIEGENTEGWKIQDAVDKLRGEKGSDVTIGIHRYGQDELIPYTITRDIIVVKSVPYAFKMDGDLGYVRCSSFGEKTISEISDAVARLEQAGINGLVLDLRNNPGGLLAAAREVSEFFLESGQLIVSTRHRDGVLGQELYARGGQNKAGDYPVVVLINEQSASASEIVAGAVQDWDRGLVVGRNSFGKGSVQSIFPLSELEALKLTTAKYYTPSGRCIHRDEYNHKFNDAENDTLTWEDITAVPLEELPPYATMRLNRTVRGGGGIMPDVIVESEEFSDLALDLERRAAFFNFSIELSAEREIREDFVADEAILNQFKEFLAGREIEYEEEQFEEEREYLAMAIRRELFYNQFGAAEAYRSTLHKDLPLQEAMRLLRENHSTDRLLASVLVKEDE